MMIMPKILVVCSLLIVLTNAFQVQQQPFRGCWPSSAVEALGLSSFRSFSYASIHPVSSSSSSLSATTGEKVVAFKKGEMVSSIASKTGLKKADSEAALAAVLETIEEQLTLGKKISLIGFGSFQAKPRAARKGRNPQTGAEIDIPASLSPSFTAAKSLKNKVNGKE